MEVSGQLHALGTHWIGGWVGPRAGLDAVENRAIPLPLPGMEIRLSRFIIVEHYPEPHEAVLELGRRKSYRSQTLYTGAPVLGCKHFNFFSVTVI
jgi:hypothetical protein